MSPKWGRPRLKKKQEPQGMESLPLLYSHALRQLKKIVFFLTSGSGGGPGGRTGQGVCWVWHIYGAISGRIYGTIYGTIKLSIGHQPIMEASGGPHCCGFHNDGC